MTQAEETAFGHDLIELLAEHHRAVGSQPTLAAERSDAIRRATDSSAWASGGDPAEVLRDLRTMLVGLVHMHSPTYLGHQVPPPLSGVPLVEAYAATMNPGLAVEEIAPVATAMDNALIQFLADKLGFDDDARGTFVPGGSLANLTALLVARRRALPGAWTDGTPTELKPVVVCSAESHYCITRSVAIMGLGMTAVRLVPTDERFRMTAAALDTVLDGCRAAGETPIAVVAVAGSTPTGAFDPIGEIADVCRSRGLWLHVDGAHGASVILSGRYCRLLDGIERADSVTWDPHKMRFLPAATSVLIVRDGRWLRAAFGQDAPYLFADGGEAESPNIGEMTLQCTRPWDSLKLWAGLRLHGADAIGRIIDQCAEMTQELAAMLRATGVFEPLHEPDLNILCFRWAPPDQRDEADGSSERSWLDQQNLALRTRLNASGHGWLTTTVLRGKRAIRAVVINPATDRAALDRLVAALVSLAPASNPEGVDPQVQPVESLGNR